MIEDPCYRVSPQAIARGIEDLLDENERLNNIINKLEKYCKIERATSQFVHECNTYNDVLMKLKELKENKE